MSYTDGHIYAPVSIDDVKYVIAESSFDLATLCTSDKINPYSLIRPAYTTNSEFGPEDFEKGIAEGPIPEGGTEWQYSLQKWGYYVPFVGSLGNISLITEKTWVRNAPDEKSLKCLSHFDGYLHNAVPSLPVSADVTPGSKIVMFLQPGNVQQDIISSSGMSNNGGVVAIYEVLGSVKIGCSLFHGSQLIGHYISPNAIGSDNYQEKVQVDTSEIAEADTTYKIIPWATNGDLINGTPTYGSSFYTLKYAPDFDGFLSITTPHYYVAIVDVNVTKTDSRIAFDVVISNRYTSAQTVDYFRLRVKYMGDYDTISKEVSLYGTDVIKIAAQSSEKISLFTDDSEIILNYNNLLSMEIVARWNAAGGAQDIYSMQLAGPVRPT